MASEKKIMNSSGKGRDTKPPLRAKGGSSPSSTGGRCPKAEKDCSTCKITVCPEEEI